jgi:SAM-dependent methyltransferase
MPSTLRRLLRHQRPAPGPSCEPEIASTAASWFEAKRPRHPSVGLPRDFLRDAQQVAKVEPHWRSLLDDPAIIAAMDRDEVPIPHPENREGYYANCHLNYWLSGAVNLRTVRSVIPAETLARVLDFGGATGRFARHAAAADESEVVTIADLSLNHVQWVDENFGPKVRSVKVCPQPHFPLPDRSITLCVGISVFTHIDEHESGWLAEINRVLADGGWAYLTILSEDTWTKIRENPPKGLAEDQKFLALWRPGEPMPAERLVFDYKPGTKFHCCNTFVSTDYVRRSWGRWFEIAGIHLGLHNRHTVVVLHKRN